MDESTRFVLNKRIKELRESIRVLCMQRDSLNHADEDFVERVEARINEVEQMKIRIEQRFA